MIFLCDLFDGRREHAARAAPSRPKIHQYRPVRLHNFGIPIRITNLSDKLTHFYLLKSYNGLLKIYHYAVSISGFSARALYQTPSFAGTLRGAGEQGREGAGERESERREEDILIPLSLAPPLSRSLPPSSPLSRDDLAISGHIIVRRTVPGEVLAHAVELEFAPCLAVVIDHRRLIKLLDQAVARILVEFVAVPPPRRRLEISDRVIQSADAAHDRRGAIFQAVHLIQSARLISRRHQENVCAGFDLVRERVVISEIDADLGGHRVAHVLEIAHVTFGARTEQDEIRAGLHEAPDGLRDQIDPFLRSQARDDRDHRFFQIDRQLIFFEQVAFAGRLAAEVVDSVVGRDVSVGLRVPHVVIDAVQNADQAVAALAQ